MQRVKACSILDRYYGMVFLNNKKEQENDNDCTSF